MKLELHAKMYAVEVFDHDGSGDYETMLLSSEWEAALFVVAIEKELKDGASVCLSSTYERFISLSELASMKPVERSVYGRVFHMFLGENVA